MKINNDPFSLVRRLPTQSEPTPMGPFYPPFPPERDVYQPGLPPYYPGLPFDPRQPNPIILPEPKKPEEDGTEIVIKVGPDFPKDKPIKIKIQIGQAQKALSNFALNRPKSDDGQHNHMI